MVSQHIYYNYIILINTQKPSKNPQKTLKNPQIDVCWKINKLSCDICKKVFSISYNLKRPLAINNNFYYLSD